MFAQTTATNTATITPPSGVINPGTACTAAGSTYVSSTGACSATDTDTVVAPQLTITKTASAASFTVGVAASYTLQVSNTGTAATTAASTVTDAIPTGLTIGTLPAGCTAAGQTVTCTVATGLAVGTNTSFVIPVTPTPAAGTSVTNAATVSGGGDATCPATARCTSSVTTPVSAPQLTILKTASSASFTVGIAASYTLQVTNTGAAATTATSTITDTIPAGLTIGTLPAGCTAAGQALTCTIPSGLAASASASFVIPVIAQASIGGTTVSNTALVSGGGDTGCPAAAARCSSTVSTPVIGVPAYDFCPIGVSKPVFSLVNGARVSRYEPGAASDAFVPELDFAVAGDVNGAMVDPIRNRLLFVSRSGGNSILWAFDAANGGWYQAATPFASPDFPRAGMSAAGVGYLIAGGSANPQVWRVNASTAPGSYTYTVALLGNLSYDFAPSDLGSGDIAFDASGAGWISAGRDLYKVDVTTLQAIRQTQPLLNGSPSTINWAGVAYAADGTLYLASNGAPSRYFGYNPATGILTQAASTTANASRDLASCAFPVQAVPQLSTVKSLAQVNGVAYVPGAPVKAGDTLTYAVAISNTGGAAATLYPGDVVETLPANTTVITAGNSFTCSGSSCPNTAVTNVPANGNATLNFVVQVVTPFPSGATASIVNAVTVKDMDCAASGNDCGETTAVALPALTLDKTTTATAYSAVGQVIAYSYLVTNSGNVALTAAITVNDDKIVSPNTVACPALPAGGLLPTQSITCTASYTVTQADIDAGTVVNVATATDGTTTSPSDTVTVNATQTPALTLDKTTTSTSYAAVGDVLAYEYLVTNSGNVTLTAAISVSDDKIVSPNTVACPGLPTGGLLPTQSITCTASYTVTQADINAGTVVNVATATDGTTTSPSDTVTVTATQTPSLTVDKTAGTPSGNSAGSTIAYTFLVTNTGNVTLTGIAINDALLDAPATCVATTLIPAATTTCTGTHTITQAEVNAGTVNNSATASGTLPGGGTTTSPPDTTSTPIASAPALTVDKTAGTPSGNSAGSTIAYSFLVTNTGNVTLIGIAINDALLDAAAVCPVTTLAPGASTTCTGTHTITQAEVNAGTVNNSATASGTPPTGPAITSPPDTTTTPIVGVASLTLDKTAVVADTNGNTVLGDAGDAITYGFVVTNTGTVTLAPVTVSDPLLPSLVCTISTLEPSATDSCAATGNTYTTTTADAAAGSRANTATAIGDAPGAVADPTGSDTVTTATAATPIDAVDDTFPSINGATGGNTASVLVNDTLNGVAVTATMVTLTPGTSPNPGLVMNPDGTITIAPGTAAGTYSYPYTICETLNPTNCDTATATVVVGAAPIVAVDDTTAVPVNGNTGGTAITNIFANDTLNGLPVVRAEITVTNTTVPPQLVFDPATGAVSVVPGSPAGTYTFDYTICELLNPANCATAVVTVVVEAALIEATDDSFPLVNGGQGGTTATVITNDTLDGQPITLGTGGNATLTPGTSPAAGLSMNPDGSVTIAPGTPAGTYQYPYTICEVLNPDNCDTAIATVLVGAAVIDAVDDTFPSVNGENGGNTASVLGNDTLDGAPVTAATVTLTPGTSPNPGLLMNPDGTITIAPGTAAGTYTYPYTICEVLNPSNCDTANATVVVVSDFALRVLKTAAVREVKIGDLVRYTITVENVGTSNLVDGSVLDTPAPGFSYVEGSLTVVDGDNMATATGQSPIRFDGLDITAGETATLVYAMRVGAGVRPGVQVNEALALTQGGQSISNVSRAEVTLVADALVDDSLLIGTVFDDRDSDGWQDSAALGGVHVQGGFAPTAYVPNSTTVDRGAGPQPQADASSPMLHGVDVGAISARQSVADPVENHQVVIRQRLSELAFTGDFVLTSAQGVSVRMDAAGNTTVEKSGEAAKGLNSAEPKVERRVAQGEGGYVVDYVISNLGIDERGIPGVRIASVEGLLIETDQFGRYHLEGIAGGDTGRGRNFILKVDPSTLPSGTVFTTDNPLVRRITPGVPVRFDFGVKLPVEEIQGGEQQVELELGEVIFAPGSARLREEYLPVIDQIAAKVAEYRGGEVLISANGDSEALAFERATVVKTALLEKVPADIAGALKVSVRAEPDDPSSMVVGIAEGGPLLGTVLFDTDKSTVRPQFLPMLDKVANYLGEKGGGSVAIVGHADPRATDAYNLALGMRRAKAVYEVLAAKLSPEVRAKVRVESSNDPAAPAGSK